MDYEREHDLRPALKFELFRPLDAISALAWIYLGLLLLWLVLRATPLAFNPLVAFGAIVAPWLWVLWPLAAAWSVVERRWLMMLVVLVTMAGFIDLFGSLFVERAGAYSGGDRIRVVTYNILVGNPQALPYAQNIVGAGGADLLGMQEVGQQFGNQMRELFAESMPHVWIGAEGNSSTMGTLSAWPAERLEPPEVQYQYGRQPLALRVRHPAGDILAITLHAPSSFPDSGSYDAVGVFWGSFALRQAYLEDTAIWAQSFGLPIIVMGDFNTTAFSPEFAGLSRLGLSSAWHNAGLGFGFTAPAELPFAQVDMIMHSDHFRTLSIERLPWEGRSDHRAIRAELELIPPDTPDEPVSAPTDATD